MSIYLLHTRNSALPSFSSEILESGHYVNRYLRLLFYFNIYRLIIVNILIIIACNFRFTNFGSYDYWLLLYPGLSYMLFSSISMLSIKFRGPNWDWQLTIQAISDITFFCIMLYDSGSLQSKFRKLVVSINNQSRNNYTWSKGAFFASIATIGLLVQESYALLTFDFCSAQYS